ncbi:LEF-2 [Chrysodeixis chalcites nucleopolyhedrovirus]|uniref:LEF-2 n=1 Tax=Chrysodeixis chalcites nucleopolyhedrovirus TaxID=320432 RepID=Q4KSU5_9ABAC|nr:LEF-2 [Chrysodeixis chalcites nucleopolyhedrovirus]AGC36350.1 LEF-2 protein [Chrysodeixis chalcites SNPV TF1-A]AAY84067.1 LEF-2 [Chrysodeixis chalcites nucleopolyhedrovirus]AGE61395.1 LEF-2 [Chrysodeixis chalcites nucleopolyhedrovirus]AGE61542.1 LEF-2 [Chrysodeixis chalcites nucleopolyhedrovirus]AGE61696.1 LEF-2 [Chrysodeixis chalcites nucleopolyhedrovirus]
METHQQQSSRREQRQEVLLWTPLLSNLDDIDKNADYRILIDDFDIDITPYTVFENDGATIKISGLRLYYLLKNKRLYEESMETQCSSNKTFKKSLKKVCFTKAIQGGKNSVVAVIKSKLRLPPCIQSLLSDIDVRPRGNRFRKRFIFNCYIANLITCPACDKQCIVDAMAVLYLHDDKCVREFEKLLNRNKDVYKPPSCLNMQNKERLCPNKTGMGCKGRNPLCNF